MNDTIQILELFGGIGSPRMEPVVNETIEIGRASCRERV